MDVEIVVYLFLDEVAHILIDGFSTIRGHRGATQLNLGLALEDRFFYIEGDGSHDTIADIAILVLAKILLDGLGDMLLEGTLMVPPWVVC